MTSPPVGTMATTDQPSAALAVSLVARADGSYEEALIDSNSCMVGERSVTRPPVAITLGEKVGDDFPDGRLKLGRTSVCTSVSAGAPS